jgi:hypothetical protein
LKAYGGVETEIYVFLISALVRGKWPSSHPNHFTPAERDPDIHWIEGWVGPRTGLDNIKRRNILPLPGFEP